jgi:hypothetical protein
MTGGNAPDAPHAPKTGDAALRQPLQQSPNTEKLNADDGLPISIVRNLIYSGAPEDLAQLRQIVDSLTPRSKANLMATIARETRDPRFPSGIDPQTKKARPISLTPEGEMLMSTVFDGTTPAASWITNKPATPGGGVRLSDVEAEGDLAPKTFHPDKQSDQARRLKDEPNFRSTEEVKEDKDGNLYIAHTDQHYDGQTKKAIERANEGLRVNPIFDDALNTPPGLRAGTALASGTRTPQQEATRLMHRLAQTTNAHGVIDSVSSDDPLMFNVADSRGDRSVFAPGNTGSKIRKHVATVRPADHSDALRAFQTVKKGEFTHPNQQFNSAEDFARAFVESVDQEGLNVTPITPRERADATGMIDDYSHNPDAQIDRIVNGDSEGDVSPATAGRMMREKMSDTVRSTKTAERAVMQEQAIATLARKFDDIFGHQGWGENYKPSTRPGDGSPVAPAGGIGEGVATTQDPNAVPKQFEASPMQEGDDAAFEYARPNVRGEAPAPKTRVAPGKPGMEIGEDVDADDLADLHQQRVGGDGSPVSTEEVEPSFARGRDLGDRTGMGRTKTKELPGNKPGEYEDKRPFAAYNRENRVVSDSDLERRRKFQEQWNATVGGETERSSTLRQQLRALLESNEPEAPGTSAAAAKATQVAELQRRLRLAERLDSMSGINSMSFADVLSDNGDAMRRSRPDKMAVDLEGMSSQLRSYLDEGDNSIPGYPHSRLEALVREIDDVHAGRGTMDQARIDRLADEMEAIRKGHDGFQPHATKPQTGTGMIPSKTSDLSTKLDPSSTPIDADEILPPRDKDFDLNNEPIDAEFEVKKPTPNTPNAPDVTPEPAWKKWAKRAGVVGGGILGYEMLRRGGEPPINGGPPPGGGGGGGGGPMDPPGGPGGYVPYGPPGGPMGQDLGAKPEDRIRALQNFQMQLNPNTQILQSYTR